MLKKAKLFTLVLGIITGIIGVYLFVLMDFTFIGMAGSLTDGLGFRILSAAETEGFTRFIYNITAAIPFFSAGTHELSLWYIIIRIVDIVLLFMSVGFIFYGVMGPSSNDEMEAMMQGMDEGELE